MGNELLYAILGIIFGGVVIWFLMKRGKSGPADLGNNFSELERHVTDRLDRVTEQLDKRLRENVRAMDDSKNFLAERVSHTERSMREVSTGLGRLEQIATALKHNTDDISSFQQLLKSPKFRGSFGEVLLMNLLGEVLPGDRWSTQYTLQSGEIADAVIKLQDGYIVAVDAKFPLANYEAFQKEQDQAQKKALRSQFIRDVKKHVADISKKYISASDHTLDFAFMYIPVEGVYYETIMRNEGDSLWEFCVASHVMPVSPNSFLAYLQTVLVGLRGMRIQQQAKEILQALSQMRHDFQHFSEEFNTVGKHINNAKNKFDESTRQLDKFSNRLEQIENSADVPALPPEV